MATTGSFSGYMAVAKEEVSARLHGYGPMESKESGTHTLCSNFIGCFVTHVHWHREKIN